ncbi:MAG: glycoside hydrolase family 16 protein [Acholeplasmatales bacterium]|jgi:beta-glucanase (GH16 family)|nr:glycoside hydrolase family 16 protein [Acholeplasmatales bacterium]
MKKFDWFKTLIIVETIAIVVIFIGTLFKSFQGEPLPAEKSLNRDFTLVFQDEFDGLTLDLLRWKIEDFSGNNNLRRAGYYSKDNVFLQNGNLVIRTNYSTSNNKEGWYTGWIESSVNVNQKNDIEGYQGFNSRGGYFEIRAQVPDSIGIWSAFWMMPDNNNYGSDKDILSSAEDGAEIDIMESPYAYLGSIMKEKVTPVVHADEFYSSTWYNDDSVKIVTNENGTDKYFYEYLKSYSGRTYYVPKLYTSMHTYGVDWYIDDIDDSNSYLRFYVDDRMTFEINSDWNIKQLNRVIKMSIPKVSEYLLLTVEVGGTSENGVITPGSWCGDPNKNDKSKNYDFLVDYVRVYKRN